MSLSDEYRALHERQLNADCGLSLERAWDDFRIKVAAATDEEVAVLNTTVEAVNQDD